MATPIPPGRASSSRAVATPVEGEYPGREQTIDAGSYLSVPDHERLRALAGFTVMAKVWPTTPGAVAGG